MSFCPNCGHDLGPTSAEASPEEVLTAAEAASLLKVPARTLDAWRNRRTGPRFYRIGRHVRYTRADLMEWLETRGGDDR